MSAKTFNFDEAKNNQFALPDDVQAASQRLIQRMAMEISEQREFILKAWFAKYGFDPDRAVQIEARQPDGTTHWFVRRMTDEEWDKYQKVAPEIM